MRMPNPVSLVLASLAFFAPAIVLAAPMDLEEVQRRDTSGAHFVVYQDVASGTATGFPDPDDLKGYNIYNMAFHLVSGPTDLALSYLNLGADGRKTVKDSYAAAGIKMMVAVFGGTEAPTTQGMDPVQMGKNIAFFVGECDLDGAEIDYEDFAAISKDVNGAVNWLVSFMKELRSHLPVGKYLVTHAPIAPWLAPGGPYQSVHQQVGDLIDWYNVQFYNQGTTEYVDCNGLFTQSGGQFPQSSVFEIAATGIPLDKIVVGKPASTADAGQGNMDPATLATCLPAAQAQGWNTGIMVFQFPHGDAQFIQTARGTAFPL